ncbi:hypothetical protein DMB95_00160 [Campylobacter sp. MIT 12-8780]|uniref:protein-export chaperone SecB n=1 Tax=unclassified Campylobacter TaxID=2593542 RepID=UPI00115EF497|nr:MULTISPECIES: protein-export chaperone SecB [unclassified Campylobacter]NDJ26372.1 hypothetical protein [Campylobacter sp. MIT 19-121]TQR42949.1 hypothetical protein DMB95_00160 [Campylobacter sp. MIT 12-8780]
MSKKEGFFKLHPIRIVDFNFNMSKDDASAKKLSLKRTITADALFEEEYNKYTMQVSINIKVLDKSVSPEELLYTINSKIITAVSFNKNENGEDYLQNAVAIIYSYFRPIVSQMVMMARLSPWVLPPANFEDFKVNVIPIKNTPEIAQNKKNDELAKTTP